MSDRNDHPYPSSNATYTSTHWNNGNQFSTGYAQPSSQTTYPSSSAYGSPASHAYPSSSQQYPPSYGAQEGFAPSSYQSYAMNQGAQYTRPRSMSVSLPQQLQYPPINQPVSHGQTPPPQYARSRHSHTPSLPQGAVYSPPQYPGQSSPRIQHHPGQYIPQPSSSSPVGSDFGEQYPASPSRPYSCDMCALSFNRQHDLKRHRDTHTGEKPYYCNGGCNKTFTRKDALKRHQLVKNCGLQDQDGSS